jgi:uncharacterized membrane protein
MAFPRRSAHPAEPVPYTSPDPGPDPGKAFRVAGTAAVGKVGWSLLAVWLTVVMVLSLVWPNPYVGTWLILVQQLLGGRALGIATGISLEFPKAFLIAHVTLTDLILVMILYPLLIRGARHATRLRIIGRVVVNARRTAEHYRRKLQGIGPAGLALFVFVPVWSTGPMTGSVLGNLLGFPHAVTFLAVAAGNLGAVTVWTLLFAYIQGFSDTYGKWLPVAILAAILLAFLGTRLRRAARRRALRRG